MQESHLKGSRKPQDEPKCDEKHLVRRLYDPIGPATSAKRRMQSHDTEDIAHWLFLTT
jgi:hypothetical protein